MNYYPGIVAFFRLIAVCVGLYYAYVLISLLAAPSPDFMPAMQAELLRYNQNAVIRQSGINVGGALILYFIAPFLGQLITLGRDRR